MQTYLFNAFQAWLRRFLPLLPNGTGSKTSCDYAQMVQSHRLRCIVIVLTSGLNII